MLSCSNRFVEIVEVAVVGAEEADESDYILGHAHVVLAVEVLVVERAEDDVSDCILVHEHVELLVERTDSQLIAE